MEVVAKNGIKCLGHNIPFIPYDPNESAKKYNTVKSNNKYPINFN